jgi:hypothetical protein
MRALSAALAALAAAWLYRRALGLAYFNDDPTGHFAWMEGQSLRQFFTSSAEYGYYRPVVFAILRLFEQLFGGGAFPHNSLADHALLVLLHGANAALVWALAFRLGRRAHFAWAAALVFAAAPFSYEAVGYVASLTHPLLVFWVLLALLSYERGSGGAGEQGGGGAGESRVTSTPKSSTSEGADSISNTLLSPLHLRALAPLLFLTLGLLTHENGLFILPALVGLDWVRRPADTVRERLRRLWPFAIPTALYVLLWLAVPKNSEQGLNTLADIARNTVPFLQTLVYPLLPLLRLDAGDIGALVALALIVVAIFGALAWRAGVGRLWVFALGWVALSALPSLLFLRPAYVYGSPRLSYLPVIGVGLLWGLPLLRKRETTDSTAYTDRKDKSVQSVKSVVSLLYIVALTLPAWPFVRCQLDFYDETSRITREMARAAAGAPVEQDVLFVNLPFFFSSYAGRPDGCPNPYPWTPVGGILIPPYAQVRDFVRFNGGPDRPTTGVTFPGYAPGWRTFGPEIEPGELRAALVRDAVYVFDLSRGSFTDLSAAWQPGAAGAAPPRATFGDTLALVGAELSQAGDALDVTLTWRVLAVPDAPLASFVHVYDAAGALAAQSDGPPGGSFAPPALWQPGDVLTETRRIDLSGLPPGAYTVATGVYNPSDGARLPAESDGRALADGILLIGEVVR